MQNPGVELNPAQLPVEVVLRQGIALLDGRSRDPWLAGIRGQPVASGLRGDKEESVSLGRGVMVAEIWVVSKRQQRLESTQSYPAGFCLEEAEVSKTGLGGRSGNSPWERVSRITCSRIPINKMRKGPARVAHWGGRRLVNHSLPDHTPQMASTPSRAPRLLPLPPRSTSPRR